MKAAIYARKSNDDNDRDADNKSVTRQVEHARAFAEAKGWTVDDEHIFIDDGISGAEYQNRPGFLRLMNALKHFDVLVMSESSRLGRDMMRNATAIVEIIESGPRIFYYLTGEEEKADTPEQRIMVTLRSYASEVERQKASQRSRDALERKARSGFNTGGCVYGYDNVQVFGTGANGEPVKSHTDYKINEEQADVIRRMFRMYADGYGHVSVAKTLNGDPRYADQLKHYFEGIAPTKPRVGKRGTGSWAPSSIRAMLYNERYTGRVPFGEFRGAYLKGTKVRVKQDAFMQAERHDLRIVDAELWAKVQERLKAVAKTYLEATDGVRWGRPGAGVESKYLLTGLGRCAVCGGNITMLGGYVGSAGTRKPIRYYGCSHRQNRGSTICTNDHRAHMEEADAAILSTIKKTILTPEAVDYIVDEAARLIAQQQTQATDRPQRLEAELRKDRRKLDNFIALIADGNAPASILGAIRELEQGIETKTTELSRLTMEQPSELDQRRIKKQLREQVGKFDELIHSDVPIARQALRKLMAGPIAFSPVLRDGRKGYALKWETKIGVLLSTPTYIGVASPRGFEPRLPP